MSISLTSQEQAFYDFLYEELENPSPDYVTEMFNRIVQKIKEDRIDKRFVTVTLNLPATVIVDLENESIESVEIEYYSGWDEMSYRDCGDEVNGADEDTAGDVLSNGGWPQPGVNW